MLLVFNGQILYHLNPGGGYAFARAFNQMVSPSFTVIGFNGFKNVGLIGTSLFISLNAAIK